MTITKLKAKNQVTIPMEIVKELNLKPDEFLSVDLEGNYIKLTPVDIEPRYTPEDMDAIDRIVKQEKSKAKALKPGKEFSRYIEHLTK